MALTNTCIRFLIWAKKQGAEFKNVLTLGHLENQTTKKTLELLSDRNTDLIEKSKINWDDSFADSILLAMGAESVESMDYSQYENATIQFDLNNPLPETLYSKFSIIIDGGTLEHIFDFRQAIKNCMLALKTGGYFIGFSPANNLMGHGFYQFSPELFYRVFSKENGFQIKGVYLVATDFNIDTEVWYEVKDPNEIKERVMLQNKNPAFLMIAAQKISEGDLFKSGVFQSDYQQAWANKKVENILITKINTSKSKKYIKRLLRIKVKEENLEKINPRFYKKRNS